MNKITADHLARKAIVYVRQSSVHQVRHNTGSQAWQYDLETRAKALGWPEVTFVDQDLGLSGSGTERPGFQSMLAAVCDGKVGIILSVDATRLARNGRDWHTLLEFCGIVDCLLADEQMVYDPRLPTDRMVLGMQGAMGKWSALHLPINGKRTVIESWSAPALQTRRARPGSLTISIRSPLRHSMTRGEQQWGFLTRAVHDRERAGTRSMAVLRHLSST